LNGIRGTTKEGLEGAQAPPACIWPYPMTFLLKGGVTCACAIIV